MLERLVPRSAAVAPVVLPRHALKGSFASTAKRNTAARSPAPANVRASPRSARKSGPRSVAATAATTATIVWRTRTAHRSAIAAFAKRAHKPRLERPAPSAAHRVTAHARWVYFASTRLRRNAAPPISPGLARPGRKRARQTTIPSVAAMTRLIPTPARRTRQEYRSSRAAPAPDDVVGAGQSFPQT